jgi:hypothetical protein
VSPNLPPPIPAEELVPWWEWREGKRPPSGVWTMEDEDRAEQAHAETPQPTGPLPELVSLDDFLATEEAGAGPLVGAAGNVVIPEGGDVMLYGDGGAGKTTLAVDLAFHLAAGDDWVGLPIPHAAVVALVENEGPRPLFREKLRRKRDGWTGSSLGDRLTVLERPWAEVSFADEAWREALAVAINFLAIDVLIAGPVTRLGMNEAGTLQEVRDFMALVDELRQQTGRRLTVILIHHESKSGQVSGAWEAAGDTLCHVQGQGHGRTRLFFQKVRWASAQHGTALNLLWADGEGFEVEEREEFDDETLAELILSYVEENAGTAWGKVRASIKGVGNDRVDAIRDGLFAAGRLVNVVGGEALSRVEPRRAASLYLPDDITIRHLCPIPGTSPAQSELPLAAEGAASTVPCAAPIRRHRGTGTADTPPSDEERAQ